MCTDQGTDGGERVLQGRGARLGPPRNRLRKPSTGPHGCLLLGEQLAGAGDHKSKGGVYCIRGVCVCGVLLEGRWGGVRDERVT